MTPMLGTPDPPGYAGRFMHRWVVLGRRGRWLPACAECDWHGEYQRVKADAVVYAKAHERAVNR